MSSQEDYLDSLLKGLNESTNNKSSEPTEESIFDVKTDEFNLHEEKESVDIQSKYDDVSDMPESIMKQDDFEDLRDLEIQGVFDVQETPVEQTTSVEQTTPIEQTTSVKQTTPIEQTISVEQTTSEEQPTFDDQETDDWFDDDNAVDKTVELNSDIEAISGLTEEEIERLLSVKEETPIVEKDAVDDDVMSLLEDSDDTDLGEIKTLLHKSEKNELIDDSLLDEEENPSEDELLERILSTSEEETDGELQEKKVSPREARRAEAKARRAAAKAKRAEMKAAKKMEKAAAKAAKSSKAAKPSKGEKSPQTTKLFEPEKSSESEEPTDKEDNSIFNSDDLDSIIAGLNNDNSENTNEDDLLDEKDHYNLKDFNEENDDVPDGLKDKDLNDELSQDEITALFGDDGETALKELLAGTEQSEEEDGLSLSDLLGETDFSDNELEEIPDKNSVSGSEALDVTDSNKDNDFPDFIAFTQETSEKKKKKGLLSRILEFLTAEDEEEKKENDELILSKENKDILDELDGESKSEKKSKKSKKNKKDNKGKKDKKSPEDEGEEAPKKEKPTKPKKPKKEKIQEPVSNGKKLSPKKIIPIVLVGISVAILLLVFVNSSIEYTDRKTAEVAYQKGDYQTCYQNLYGKKRNESEQIMFGKSESILRIRLWVREYEMFAEQGELVQALDSLIQTVDRYPELYEYAKTCNAEYEVVEEYAKVLNYLMNIYGLTEGQALEIAAEPNDFEYTVKVTAIANGTDENATESPTTVNEENSDSGLQSGLNDSLPDMLPEEEELEDDNFFDNR